MFSLPFSGGSIFYRDAFHSGDQEPWMFRGGLQGEFQVCTLSGLLTQEFRVTRSQACILFEVYTVRALAEGVYGKIQIIATCTCNHTKWQPRDDDFLIILA